MKLPQHYQDGVPSVEFYDLRERGGPGTIREGDIEFYLAQARKTRGPILDLACGTGRVALQLPLAGFSVAGIERAPVMLAIARAKQRLRPRNPEIRARKQPKADRCTQCACELRV
jgi:SAM-dependent methyltransferase